MLAASVSYLRGVTASWTCRECGDGPFHSGQLDEHVNTVHGHPLGTFDFDLRMSTAVRQRPPEAEDEGPLTEPLF